MRIRLWRFERSIRFSPAYPIARKSFLPFRLKLGLINKLVAAMQKVLVQFGHQMADSVVATTQTAKAP